MAFWHVYMGIYGGGNGTTVAVDVETDRLDLFGTPEYRLTLYGSSQKRLTLLGSSS